MTAREPPRRRLLKPWTPLARRTLALPPPVVNFPYRPSPCRAKPLRKGGVFLKETENRGNKYLPKASICSEGEG